MTRIIAGLAKGRPLAVPSQGTRPTSDRAREGLFNTLASRVRLDGARVLDLYAGTGAVGLEALSRGAAAAVLVESNARAVEVIRGNVDAVELPGADVVHSPVNRFELGDDDEPFDIVFADPPYAGHGSTELIGLTGIVMSRWLADDGVLVIETSARAGVALDGIPDLTWFQQKRYGEALLWYGRRR